MPSGLMSRGVPGRQSLKQAFLHISTSLEACPAPPPFRVGGARRPRRPRPGRVRGVGIGGGPPQGRGGDAGAAAEAQAAQGSGSGASGASEADGCGSPVQVPAEPVPPEVLRVLRARDVLLGGVRLLGLPQPGGVREGGSERHRERQETVPGTVQGRVRRQDCPAGRGRGAVGAPAGVQVPAEFMPEALLRVLRGGGGMRSALQVCRLCQPPRGSPAAEEGEEGEEEAGGKEEAGGGEGRTSSRHVRKSTSCG